MTKDQFTALHDSAAPLVLFNIWDAGSAKTVENAGAKALATGSLSVAGAQGFEDGEELPLDALLTTLKQIARVISVPLSVDFETGYGEDINTLRSNAEALHAAGAIGCNLEDRLIGEGGLRDLAGQCERIATVSDAGLFVNARTDVFLGPLMKGENPSRADLVETAIVRGKAFADAGADCFFIPGLSDPEMIAQVCAAVPIPVNIMRFGDMAGHAELGRLGVSRISYGPGPWRDAMAQLATSARAALS